jgi:hypothetical protein
MGVERQEKGALSDDDPQMLPSVMFEYCVDSWRTSGSYSGNVIYALFTVETGAVSIAQLLSPPRNKCAHVDLFSCCIAFAPYANISFESGCWISHPAP